MSTVIRRFFLTLLVAISLIQRLSAGSKTALPVSLKVQSVQMEGPLSSPNFDQADARLNTVYDSLVKKVSHSPTLVRDLKQTELSWIKFRDEWSRLEALIKGEPGMDKAMLTQLTEDRAQQLEHLIETGLLEDPISYRTQPHFIEELSSIYDLDRQAVVDHKNGPLLTEWLATQKAWSEWYNSESIFVPEISFLRSDLSSQHGVFNTVFMCMYAHRIDDLKQLAGEL